MYSGMGLRVVAMDLDPQCTLSSMFLDAERMDEIWNGDEDHESVDAALRPLIGGTGDIAEPHIEAIEDRLGLVVGSLALPKTEDEFSSEWPKCLDGKERAFRVISGFHRIVRKASARFEADIVLLDVGPSLGALNRAALIAAWQRPEKCPRDCLSFRLAEWSPVVTL